jgi:hypothetical protein
MMLTLDWHDGMRISLRAMFGFNLIVRGAKSRFVLDRVANSKFARHGRFLGEGPAAMNRPYQGDW